MHRQSTVRTGGGGAGRGSQQEAIKLFCKKCCQADAATPYFKEREGLGPWPLHSPPGLGKTEIPSCASRGT